MRNAFVLHQDSRGGGRKSVKTYRDECLAWECRGEEVDGWRAAANLLASMSELNLHFDHRDVEIKWGVVTCER